MDNTQTQHLMVCGNAPVCANKKRHGRHAVYWEVLCNSATGKSIRSFNIIILIFNSYLILIICTDCLLLSIYQKGWKHEMTFVSQWLTLMLWMLKIPFLLPAKPFFILFLNLPLWIIVWIKQTITKDWSKNMRKCSYSVFFRFQRTVGQNEHSKSWLRISGFEDF